MLEMMLFIALPRRDTKPIAKELLARLRHLRARHQRAGARTASG